MTEASQDRNARALLISLIGFLLLSAFVPEGNTIGEAILSLSMYLTLVAGTLELSQKKSLRLPAVLLSSCSMVILLLYFFRPTHATMVASWLFLGVFFGFISIALFSYLGRPGAITNSRLYASVSLYFILGVFFYTLFNFAEAVSPHSFHDAGLYATGGVSRHSLLYLSLITLTTLGYGDVTPVSPPARMLAAIEGAVGVLYIAITVARLVAAYQRADKE